MATLSFQTTPGETNVTTIDVVDGGGQPVDLDALGAESVTAEITDSVYGCSPAQIDVPFSGNVLSAQFGLFDVRPGVYYPRVYYTTPTTAEEVIAAKGRTTQIKLTVG